VTAVSDECVVDGFVLDAPFVTSGVSHIVDDRGVICIGRGFMESFVDPDDFDHFASKQHSASIKGMINWYGAGWVSFGVGQRVQKRQTLSLTTAPTYANAAVEVYAEEMVVGQRQVALIGAGSTNQIRTVSDAFATAGNLFTVGDPGLPATGIGVIGPYFLVGSEGGAFTFRENGEPVNVMRSLHAARSPLNGRAFAEQWGWAYFATVRGLQAYRPPGTRNPVGLEADRRFEVAIGRPHTLLEWFELLFVGYHGADGVSRLMVGHFGNGVAGGKPDWYCLREWTDKTITRIGATGSASEPTVIVGFSDGNIEYFVPDGDTYHTGGGYWYGTTMMRRPGMRKYLRTAYVLAQNVNDWKYWQLACEIDDSGEYADVDVVRRDGRAILRPITAGAPDPRFSFHTIKPRLRQVIVGDGGSNASTVPPQLRGTLELVWDERPDTVTAVGVAIEIKSDVTGWRQKVETFEALADADQRVPVPVYLPDDRREDEPRWGFVTGVERLEDAGEIKGLYVNLVLWETDVAS
jgi:hypothetical protein